MEESTNTFTGGLNQDLNPIATPDNVLTDAKNATFITFNGNEMSLQNDMGNTVITYVDPLDPNQEKKTVTLPEGYVPIGMKEYGGILYIVSKNPNTDKVQIGSFPSPEFNQPTKNPVYTPETEITNYDSLLNGVSKTESGIFEIVTKMLYPCDYIEKYSFFPLNFETISTESERRLYKYRLINDSTRKDITDSCPPFNLSNHVWYKTLQVTRNGVPISAYVQVYLPDGSIYKYFPKTKIEEGIKPDAFVTYFYEVNGETKLSMYYEDIDKSKQIYCEIIPLLNIGHSRISKLVFDYGGEGIFYFPNLQAGAISFKFYTEGIDYFNLKRVEDGIIKYSPKLIYEVSKINMDNILLDFRDTFFKQNISNNYINRDVSFPAGTKGATVNGASILAQNTNKYQLRDCAEFGEKYINDSIYKNKLSKTDDLVMTITKNGNDFIPEVELVNKNYWLKFDKIRIDQLSWVKVNKIKFSYEIFNNNNPSEIIDYGSQTIDNIEVINGEWDASKINIEIKSEEIEERKLGVFLGSSSDLLLPKFLGTVEPVSEGSSNYVIVQKPFTSVFISKAQRIPNYSIRFSFIPYNTDYDIDITNLAINRVINLTLSPDSWEGNLVFKDNTQETINVSLDNFVTTELDQTNKYQLKTLGSLKGNKSITRTPLSKSYSAKKTIPYSNIEKGSWYKYSQIPNSYTSFGVYNKNSNRTFTFNQPGFITLIDTPNTFDIAKYFRWEAKVSTNIVQETGHGGDSGKAIFVKDGGTGTKNSICYNKLIVTDVDTKETKSEIDTVGLTGTTISPSPINIKSDDKGIFDISKISRQLIEERLKSDVATICIRRGYKKDGNWVTDSGYIKNLGYVIVPDIIDYVGSESKDIRFSKLYFIEKNSSQIACDSFGKEIIPGIDKNQLQIVNFSNIMTSDNYSQLYASVVPIYGGFLSRGKIKDGFLYSIDTDNISINYNYITLSFYLSSNQSMNFKCNCPIYKVTTDTEFTEDVEYDLVKKTSINYLEEPIRIKSGSKKYTRVTVICKGTGIDTFNFSLSEITGTGTPIIYNPIIYETRFGDDVYSDKNELLGTKCSDIRVQGMKLEMSDTFDNYKNKKLGGYELQYEYVPLPFYEIID